MKNKILVFTILLSTTCFAQSAVIDTTGGLATGIDPNQNNIKYNKDLEYDPSVIYPSLVKKGNDYYCYTGENDQFQLYGWQQVDTLGIGQLSWKYFDMETGKMVRNAWTEDGYYIGADGNIVEEAGNARDYSTPGFKFGTTKDQFMYKFSDGTSVKGDWIPISPANNGIYYWYYFNYNGILETNKSDIQGKFKVDKEGRYVNKDGEVVAMEMIKGEGLDLSTKPTYDNTESPNKSYNVKYNNDKTKILSVEPIDGSVIYVTGNESKQLTFLKQVEKDNAKNCDFDLQDRTFLDPYAEDKLGIMRKSIIMNGKSASFKLKCNRYNTYKLQYAIEYDGSGDEPGTKDDAYAILDAYVNAEHVESDDSFYSNEEGNILSEMEIISPKKQPITITFNSSSSDINLILTVTAMKYDKSLNEDEEEGK